MAPERIVVGVDGSPGAATALRWAVREARLRGVGSTAVYAWGFIDPRHPGGDRTFDPAYGPDDARAALGAAVTEALGPDAVDLEQRALEGEPVPTLLDAAAEAALLLVVGTRGLGGFKRLVLGSVSEKVLVHAPCPVALVPEAADRLPAGDRAPLVVGIDGSEAAQRALVWALDEARRREVRLDVVHAWDVPALATVGTFTFDPAVYEEAAEQVVEDAMAAVADRSGGVEVHPVVASGHPARVILEQAEGAGSVVVGARGLGGFAGMLLGSVSRSIAYHAPCPVVVHRSPGG